VEEVEEEVEEVEVEVLVQTWLAGVKGCVGFALAAEQEPNTTTHHHTPPPAADCTKLTSSAEGN